MQTKYKTKQEFLRDLESAIERYEEGKRQIRQERKKPIRPVDESIIPKSKISEISIATGEVIKERDEEKFFDSSYKGIQAIHRKEELEEKVKQDLLTIVNFYAVWCPPCHQFKPILERLAEEYSDSIDVFKVDVDEKPDIASSFSITAVPTSLYFKHGQEIKKLIGFKDYEKLKEETDNLLKKFSQK